METWETVSMTRKEVRRPGLVQAALAGKITTAEGARAVGVSLRQFRRLKARYRQEGAPGLVHRARGQRQEALPVTASPTSCEHSGANQTPSRPVEHQRQNVTTL